MVCCAIAICVTTAAVAALMDVHVSKEKPTVAEISVLGFLVRKLLSYLLCLCRICQITDAVKKITTTQKDGL